MTREHTHATPPRLIAAAHLVAAAEAARRLHRGDRIDDVARYVRVRAERHAQAHAQLFASLAAIDADVDPLAFARSVEPSLGTVTVPTAATTRVVDGVEQRFAPGSGWMPVAAPSDTMHAPLGPADVPPITDEDIAAGTRHLADMRATLHGRTAHAS